MLMQKIIKIIGPYVLISLILLLVLAFWWQARAFLSSLMNLWYSFKITGNVKAIAITFLVLSLILVGGYFLNKHVSDTDALHSKLSNQLFKIVTVLLPLFCIGAGIIIMNSLSAHPLLSKYAISIVNSYESKNGLPQSNLAPGWSHNDLITAESFVPKSDNYLIYFLDSYEGVQIGLWNGIPFTFHGRIENLEETSEENKETIDKNVYLVYDLKKSPKLIILKPETLKKHAKQIQTRKAGSMEISTTTLVIEIKEAAEGIKPIKLFQG